MHIDNSNNVDLSKTPKMPSKSLRPFYSKPKLTPEEDQYLFDAGGEERGARAKDTPGAEYVLNWLYRHHIVFGLLPDPARLKKIADNPAIREQALIALTHLEEEPEREEVKLLGPVFNFLSAVVGGVVGASTVVLSQGTTLVTTIIIFLLLIALVASLVALIGKNSRIRRVAIWARSWSKAIREHEEDPRILLPQTRESIL